MQSRPPDHHRRTKTDLHRQTRPLNLHAPLHTLLIPLHAPSMPPPCPPPLPHPQSILIDRKKLKKFWRFLEFREPNYLTKCADLFLAAGPRSLRDCLPVLARTIPHHASHGQPIRIQNTALLHKVASALANYLHLYSIRLLPHSISPFYSVSLSPLCTSLPQGQPEYPPHSTNHT
jgi:hypothetical protein